MKKKTKAERLNWKERSEAEKNELKDLKGILDKAIKRLDVPSKPEHGEFLIP